MNEFETLDRCAAYVAARAALVAVNRVVGSWPERLADEARRAAVDAMMITAEGIGFTHGTAGRRRCLRDAITRAVSVAATVDVARAMGFGDDDLDHAERMAGRSLALLGMFFHANAAPFPDHEAQATSA